jgi:hypothetical protein
MASDSSCALTLVLIIAAPSSVMRAAQAAAAAQGAACPASTWSRCITMLCSVHSFMSYLRQASARGLHADLRCKSNQSIQWLALLLQREKDYLLLADVPGVPKVGCPQCSTCDAGHCGPQTCCNSRCCPAADELLFSGAGQDQAGREYAPSTECVQLSGSLCSQSDIHTVEVPTRKQRHVWSVVAEPAGLRLNSGGGIVLQVDDDVLTINVESEEKGSEEGILTTVMSLPHLAP